MQIREWSKRVGLDGAITNLPKMSSLILRWSLDNTIPAKPPPPPPPSRAPPSPSSSHGCGERRRRSDAKGGEGAGGERARQRELRSSLQAFLEVRQVWRLLSGRGETDPTVLTIAGEDACVCGVCVCVCVCVVCVRLSYFNIGNRPDHLLLSRWVRPFSCPCCRFMRVCFSSLNIGNRSGLLLSG